MSKKTTKRASKKSPLRRKAAAVPETGPWLVEVSYRSVRYDPAGNALAKAIKDWDPKAEVKPRVSHLYLLEGELDRKAARQIAQDLLEDPVIQASDVQPIREPKDGDPDAGVIDVWLKPGVTDVVGQTVETGLKDFNLHGIRARCGTRYTIPDARSRNWLGDVAKDLLVNPLIHDYRIRLDR